MSTIQAVARRVGLEKTDYMQILIKRYRCNPVDLVEVRMVDGRLNVEGDVYLNFKDLTELPFNFGKIEGDFNCAFNKLITLKGAPLEVGGNFNCRKNQLVSLKYAPINVGGDFICNGNKLPDNVKEPEGIRGMFYS